MTRMDKQLKEKWVKALRSGRYKQTKGVLHDSSGNNCCLGVLCRVARVEREMLSAGSVVYDGFPGNLTQRLRKRLGILGHQQQKLIKMNDDQGKTFPEIADYIEANL